ncbi:hypothetical protein ACFFIY_03570, partial [Bhargavaea ullalensis]
KKEAKNDLFFASFFILGTYRTASFPFLGMDNPILLTQAPTLLIADITRLHEPSCPHALMNF